MSFGGPSWPVSPADFQLTKIGPNTCVGAFFEASIGGGAPNWIVGDTFLVGGVVSIRPGLTDRVDRKMCIRRLGTARLRSGLRRCPGLRWG